MGKEREKPNSVADDGKVPGLDEAFAIALRRYRLISGLSQEQLALESGMGRAFISLLERHERLPSLHTTFRLCYALGIDVAEFIQAIDAQLQNPSQ